MKAFKCVHVQIYLKEVDGFKYCLDFVKGFCLTLFKFIYCILLYFILNENIIKIFSVSVRRRWSNTLEAFVYNKASTLQVLQWFPTLKTEHWIHSPGILKYRNEILPCNMFPSDVPGASLNLRLEILKLQGLFNGVFPYLRIVNYVVWLCLWFYFVDPWKGIRVSKEKEMFLLYYHVNYCAS